MAPPRHTLSPVPRCSSRQARPSPRSACGWPQTRAARLCPSSWRMVKECGAAAASRRRVGRPPGNDQVERFSCRLALHIILVSSFYNHHHTGTSGLAHLTAPRQCGPAEQIGLSQPGLCHDGECSVLPFGCLTVQYTCSWQKALPRRPSLKPHCRSRRPRPVPDLGRRLREYNRIEGRTSRGT